jgi:hypothetical protein
LQQQRALQGHARIVLQVGNDQNDNHQHRSANSHKLHSRMLQFGIPAHVVSVLCCFERSRSAEKDLTCLAGREAGQQPAGGLGSSTIPQFKRRYSVI